ncbi:hypothetical protein KA005_44105 [bacterium]|nr:hypothetical protein [bacterium]
MGERTKPSPFLTAQVPNEAADIYRKAAEKLGYSYNIIAEGEKITENLEVSKGYVCLVIETSTVEEREKVKEEVLRLEEEASADNS